MRKTLLVLDAVPSEAAHVSPLCLLRLWAKDVLFGLVPPLPPAVDWVLPTSQGSHNGLNKRNANSVCLVFD